MNAHLVLLHAAAMDREKISPRIVRINESDVLRLDINDFNEEVWYYPQGGSYSTKASNLEAHRPGSLSIEICDQATSWLDDAIATDNLIKLDLLSHAYTSARSQDYYLAVTTGWTLCEIQLLQLAAAARINEKFISATLKRLAHRGSVGPQLFGRLNTLRDQRNKWEHGGAEPS